MRMRLGAVLVLAMVLTSCTALHTARQAARDRATCEREGYGGDSPEYRQCRADLVKKRAEARKFKIDGETCWQRGLTPNTPEFDDCRASLAKAREAARQRP